MRLKDWQQAFEGYLTGESSMANIELIDSLIGSPTLNVATGLAIYHNAYRARLQEVLRGDFPAIWHWLGDIEFERLADAYIRRFPSDHYNLRWFGKGFEAFIRQHLVPEQSAPLAELARLEWTFTLAFDAPPGTPLTLQDMACLQPEDWPTLRLRPSPAMHRVECAFNSGELWRAVKEQAAFAGSAVLDTPRTIMIWRAEMICHFRSLEPSESTALNRMTQEGWSFADLCADLAASHGEEAPLQAATWLKQWVHDGWLERHDS
ncbi:hypothetical protein D3C84_72820 [compost metagenome]